MHCSLAAATFPSTVLIMRIGRFVLVIPWILVWVIALAMMPLCWLAGSRARAQGRDKAAPILRRWHLVVLLLVMMGGTTISVRSGKHRLYLKWI